MKNKIIFLSTLISLMMAGCSSSPTSSVLESSSSEITSNEISSEQSSSQSETVSSSSQITSSEEHSHSFSDEWSKDGIYHWHESTCGHEVVSEKAEHNFDEGVVVNNPTCSSEGKTEYTCLTCGYVKTVIEDKLSHNKSEEWNSDNFTHWHSCSTCEEKLDEAEHNFITSYDQDPENPDDTLVIKTCTICGKIVSGKLGYTSLCSLTDKYSYSGGYVQPTFNRSCLGGSEFTIDGIKVNHGISMHPADTDARISFDISDNTYDTFIATVGKIDQQINCSVIFYIYVDDQLKYTSSTIKEDSMEYVEVDVAGARKLEIVLNNGGDGMSFDESIIAEPCLINKAALAPASITPENIAYVQEKGRELDTSNLTAIVRYNTGTVRRVDGNQVTITDYNKDVLGSQNIKVSYQGAVSEYPLYVAEAGSYKYIKDVQDKWTDYKSFFPSISVGTDCDDGTSFSIAGIRYDNGIGIHPVSPEQPGYLTIDISEFNFTRFHTVLGKTRKGIAYDVKFAIYGNETEIYQANLRAGEQAIVDLDISSYTTIKLEVGVGLANMLAYGSSGFADTVIY